MKDLETKKLNHIETLEDLFSLIRGGARWILAVSIVSSFLSLLIAFSLPNIYESRAKLAPKSEAEANGLSGLANQYGGLASLAGINLNGLSQTGLPKAVLALEKVKSLGFFEAYLYEKILVELMAAASWERKTGLLLDSTVYDPAEQTWIRKVWKPKSVKPSPQEAHEEFLKLLRITENSDTSVIVLSVKHLSPVVAKDWLSLIIESVNFDIRERDIKEAEQAIRFLSEQRQATSLRSLEDTFAVLMEEQMKTIMLARISEDYVFELIDPPFEPEFHKDPNRVLAGVLGALFGFLISSSWIVFQHLRNNE